MYLSNEPSLLILLLSTIRVEMGRVFDGMVAHRNVCIDMTDRISSTMALYIGWRSLASTVLSSDMSSEMVNASSAYVTVFLSTMGGMS